MIDLFTNGTAHQTAAMHALGAGLERLGCGYRLELINRHWHPVSDICVTWGTRFLRLLGAYKHRVILEAGYFNDREKFYSLGLEGLNGRAFFNNADSPSDRWLKHGVRREAWRRGPIDKPVLLIGQVSTDMAVSNVDINAWYIRMIEALRLRGLEVEYRPHPKRSYDGPPPQLVPWQCQGALHEILHGYSRVLTYNSTSAVEAAIAGVPVMAVDKGSMAWPIAAHGLDELLDFQYPDRSQWLYNLAYTQWTQHELETGEAWAHLWHKHDNATETKSAGQRLSLSP